MADRDHVVGVEVKLENRYGHNYLVVRPVKREKNDSGKLDDFPRAFSTSIFPDPGQELADLEVSGHFTDGKLIAFNVSYKSPFSVDLRQAESMLATLRKISRRMLADNANEPGDVYMAFCKTIGAKFAIFCATERRTIQESDWHVTSISDGRERLRRIIAQQQQIAAA